MGVFKRCLPVIFTVKSPTAIACFTAIELLNTGCTVNRYDKKLHLNSFITGNTQGKKPCFSRCLRVMSLLTLHNEY